MESGAQPIFPSPTQKLLPQVARRTKGRTGTKQETDKVPEEEFGKAGFQQCAKSQEHNFKHHSIPLYSGQFEKGPGYDRQANEGQFRVSAIQKVKNRYCSRFFSHLDERISRH